MSGIIPDIYNSLAEKCLNKLNDDDNNHDDEVINKVNEWMNEYLEDLPGYEKNEVSMSGFQKLEPEQDTCFLRYWIAAEEYSKTKSLD